MDNNQVEKKTPNKLIIVLVIILIIVIIVSIIVKFTTKDIDNDKVEKSSQEELIVNNKEDVVKEQQVDGLTFNNVALISQNGQSYLTVEVTNNNPSDYYLEEVHIFLKDKDGNYIINYSDSNGDVINYLVGYVGDTIVVGESRTVVSNVDMYISDETYSIEYEVIK